MEMSFHCLNLVKMEIIIKDEFIKLGQAMKLAGLVNSGIEAKIAIQEGKVKVNGQVDLRRGKKMYDGDELEFEEIKVKVKNNKN